MIKMSSGTVCVAFQDITNISNLGLRKKYTFPLARILTLGNANKKKELQFLTVENKKLIPSVRILHKK